MVEIRRSDSIWRARRRGGRAGTGGLAKTSRRSGEREPSDARRRGGDGLVARRTPTTPQRAGAQPPDRGQSLGHSVLEADAVLGSADAQEDDSIEVERERAAVGLEVDPAALGFERRAQRLEVLIGES